MKNGPIEDALPSNSSFVTEPRCIYSNLAWDIAAMLGCFVRGDEIGSPPLGDPHSPDYCTLGKRLF